MIEQPLVSIIIPTFNRAKLIPETLDSILAQTYQNWECLVIDDGSSDDTDRVLKKYCLKDNRFKYFKRPHDRLPGGNAARNYGFELSKGDFIQWFDDDDLMLPRFLSDKVMAFSESIDLVICLGAIVDKDLKILKNLQFDKSVSIYKGFVLWKNQITTNCVMFSRVFLLNKNLFNPRIIRGQESEFFSRIFFKLNTKQYQFLENKLFLYRQHSVNKTTLNQTYISEYKYSQSTICIKNFKYSLSLRDNDLINHCFQTLLIYFFSGLKHKDYKTVNYIYENLSPILRRDYFLFFLEFTLLGSLMLFFKRSSYSLHQRWKKKFLC